MKMKHEIPAGITITELSRHIDYSGERPQFHFQLQLTGPGGSAVFPYSGGVMAFVSRDNPILRHRAKEDRALNAVMQGKRLLDPAKERECCETLLRHSKPDGVGLLSCLVLDSSALDANFEDWCGDYGYDPDSRKALALYERCREQSMAFRRVVGDKLDDVRAAVEDY